MDFALKIMVSKVRRIVWVVMAALFGKYRVKFGKNSKYVFIFKSIESVVVRVREFLQRFLAAPFGKSLFFSAGEPYEAHRCSGT